MKQFLFPEQTPILIISNIVILGIIFLLLKPVYFERKRISNLNYSIALFFIVLFSLFSFWGADWFNYQSIFDELKRKETFRGHMEDIYVFSIRYIFHYYYEFRLVVWGIALFLFHLTIKRLNLNIQLSWFIFGVIFLPVFSYARVSLAMAVMIYGATLLYDSSINKSRSFCLGVLLILFSAFLHKSALLGILILIVSYFYNPAYSKNSGYYLLVLFCISILIIRFVISQFMSIDFSDSDEYTQMITNRGQGSMSEEATAGFISKYVRAFFENGSYCLCAFLSYKILNDYVTPRGIEGILRILVLLVFLCCIFSIDLGVNTSLIGGRLFRFSIIPAAITLSYSYDHHLFPRLTRFAVFFSMMGAAVLISYNLYCSLLK